MNTSNQLVEITFAHYKEKLSFVEPDDDYFSLWGNIQGSEQDFANWCFGRKLFQHLAKGQPFEKVILTKKQWGRFEKQYVNATLAERLKELYPEGFFEARKDDEVACFLPDTYGEKPFRLSFYKRNGPIHHSVYSTRDEALEYLANRGYEYAPGALDDLVGTDEWNRGLWVCKWLGESIHPMEGVKRDMHHPEVQHLFAETIEQIAQKAKQAA